MFWPKSLFGNTHFDLKFSLKMSENETDKKQGYFSKFMFVLK